MVTRAQGRCGAWLGCGQAVACVCQHQRRGYHHPEEVMEWSEVNLQPQTVCWEHTKVGRSLFSNNIDILVRVQSIYTKGAKLWQSFSPRECHLNVSDLAPPLVSLSRILSVVLHQPPSSSARPLPPPPLEISPGPLLTNQSLPWPRPANHSLGLVTECGTSTSCCYAPSRLSGLTRSNVTVWVQTPEFRLRSVQISPCQSRSQGWNEWS